jgi:hypothetical protein
MDNRPGCLSGLLKLFLIDTFTDFAQKRFGFGRGGCMGCGCGVIILIMGIMLTCSVIFGTDWFHFSF